MRNDFQPGQKVFENWTIEKAIGEGSYGKVFSLSRHDFGINYHAALKVMTIPANEAELKSVLEEGMSVEEANRYFYSMVEDIVREFALMSKLKGMTNIVSYEDHAVIPHENGIGWDILIRMELLTPLLTYAYAHPFSRSDIIHLGIDLCKALELCQKRNIIHRDIKPENIFVSEDGDFKLGDFGIARTIEKTASGLSKKGTYNYMAPEVYRGQEYGFSVDIYSAGLVLYRLLNKNRIPFMPAPPISITYSHREEALTKRMQGYTLPKPFYAQGRLPEIVCKACAFQPKDRYDSPLQMRQALEAIDYNTLDAHIIYPDGDELSIEQNLYIATGKPQDFPPIGAAPAYAQNEPTKAEAATPSAQAAPLEPNDADSTVMLCASATNTSAASQPEVQNDSTGKVTSRKRVNVVKTAKYSSLTVLIAFIMIGLIPPLTAVGLILGTVGLCGLLYCCIVLIVRFIKKGVDSSPKPLRAAINVGYSILAFLVGAWLAEQGATVELIGSLLVCGSVPAFFYWVLIFILRCIKKCWHK